MSDGAPGQDLPVGFGFRPYRGYEDHGAMAAVRLGCAERDRVDARSVVEGLPTAAEIAEASAELEEPSKNQILVVYDGSVVGYAAIRWWQERDDTWLYLHRGYLLPEHRHQGIGSAMLSWAEERIRQLVEQHGTARTAVIGANAVASEQDATALLLAAGYRRVFSLVELELGDLQQLPEQASELPAGIRTGPIGTSHYRAAWRTIVDSYAGTGFTQKWPFQDFLETADPACWRAAWNGQDMLGVALCSIRRHDHTVGEVEELSVRTDQRRLGIGRALLLDGLRSLRELVQRPPGCTRARQTRTGPTTFTRAWGSGGRTSTSDTASRSLDRPVIGLSSRSTGFDNASASGARRTAPLCNVIDYRPNVTCWRIRGV